MAACWACNARSKLTTIRIAVHLRRMVHRNHPARSASKKPRRRLLFNTAIDGPRKYGFPKRVRSLAYVRAFLNRFHSAIRTVKPVEQSCRLLENPKFRNRTSSWKYRCVGLRPPVGCRASDGIKPSGHCSRSHSTLRGANVPRGDTCASEEHWRKS